MVIVSQKVCLVVMTMTLYVSVYMVVSNNAHTMSNEQISSTWKNKSITSPLLFRRWKNPKPYLKSGIHLHLKDKPVVQSNSTIYRQARRLLHESTSAYIDANLFHVSHVHDVDSFVAVSVAYSTGDSVMPVFMLPHTSVDSQENLWNTFNKKSNPCLLNNGVTTLCCIATLVQRYHVSTNYKTISQWMCPNGVANTAATLAISTLYDATINSKSDGNEIHPYVKNLLPGHDTNQGYAWVQPTSGDSENGLHNIQLMLSYDFIAKHSLLRQWDENIMIYRFFVGVTFSELQRTSKIHNSVALSVITLFRNITSNKIIANVITKDAASSIEDVFTTMYTKQNGGNLYFFAKIRLRTSSEFGLPERYINTTSMRYAIGLYENGVTDQPWYHPCEFTQEISKLSLTTKTDLCVPRDEENDHLSIIVPLGANLIDGISNGAPFVLYMKFETENSIVTSQLHLKDVVLYPYRNTNTVVDDAYVIAPPELLSKVSFGYGLTDYGFEGTSAMHVVPTPINMVNDTIAVMSVGGSISTNAVDFKHALTGLSLTGVIVNDVFTFHLFPSPGNHTTLHNQRWLLAAVAAANNLQQAILRGALFTPSHDHGLNPDIDMLNNLCDSTQTSLAPCEWKNPVINEEVSDDALDTLLFHDVSSPTPAITTTDARNWINENIMMSDMLIPDTNSTAQHFVQNTITPSGKLVLFHPSTSFFNSSTFLDGDQTIDQLDYLSPMILCVALLSKSD